MVSGFSGNLRVSGVLENYLASSSLQQLQVKSSENARKLKLLGFWQATAKNLEKQNLFCSHHVSIEATMEWRSIIKLEEKPYCTSVSMVW